jgi:hypothetical protein
MADPLPVEASDLEGYDRMLERIRQIAGSRIAPAPEFRVHQIPRDDDPTRGVVVIEVPASTAAPHMANERYPRRDGSITSYLSERDVERLYDQRRRLRTGTAKSPVIFEHNFNDIALPAGNGVGCMDLLVEPIAPATARVPAWQAGPLAAAVGRAEERQRWRFANVSTLEGFDAVRKWRARDVHGWIAGNGVAPAASIEVVSIVAVLRHPLKLLVQIRWGLVVADVHQAERFRSAQEPGVAGELMAMLAIAGEYFVQTIGGGLVRAEVDLRGFGEAKSADSLTKDVPPSPLVNPGGRAAPNGLRSEIVEGAYGFADTPDTFAIQLIDRWLAAFCRESDDFFRWIR